MNSEGTNLKLRSRPRRARLFGSSAVLKKAFLAVIGAALWLANESGNAQSICAPLPFGAVAWWRANGDTLDSLANYAGTATSVTYTSGEVGEGFQFNGMDSDVQIPAASGLDIGQGNGLTIEAWINPDDLEGSRPIVEWSRTPGGPPYGVHLWMAHPTVGPGSIFANIVDTSGVWHVIQAPPETIKIGGYQHVAVTYDYGSGQAFLYVNGNAVVMENFGSFTPQTGYDLHIGSRPFGDANSGVFSGGIDEVTLYDHALSDTEIMQIYTAASAGKCAAGAPFIVSAPANASAFVNQEVAMRVAAGGSAPLAYQWKFNGADLPGATDALLDFTSVQLSNAGHYSVFITNVYGWTNTSVATLSVAVVGIYGDGLLLTNTQYNFDVPVTISLSNQFPNGLSFYTLDGSPPDFNSTQYTNPFVVSNTVRVRTLGYSPDFLESAETDVLILFLPKYTLTITNSPGGNVSVDPIQPLYLSNTVVNLTATPAPGWTFLQWTGDFSGTNANVSLAVTRREFVHAVFGTKLTATIAGGGSVLVDPPGGLYPYGTVVRLTAVPEPGNYFGLWGNAASGSSNPLRFQVTNATPVVSSLFAPVPSGKASLTVVPEGNGQATISPQANLVNLGATVSITATPDPGQYFMGWSGDAGGAQNPLTLAVTTNRIIYANFTHSSRLILSTRLDDLDLEGIGLTLLGDYGASYELDSSVDLRSWTNFITITNYYGATHIFDPNGGLLPQRFYRSVLLP